MSSPYLSPLATLSYIFISPNHGSSSSSMNYGQNNIQQNKQTKKKEETMVQWSVFLAVPVVDLTRGFLNTVHHKSMLHGWVAR